MVIRGTAEGEAPYYIHFIVLSVAKTGMISSLRHISYLASSNM